MPIKKFQNLINQTREIIDCAFGIVNDSGQILASSDESTIGQYCPLALKALQSREQYIVLEGKTFKKVYIKNRLEFITFIESDGKDSLKYLSLFSINLMNVKQYYDEKFNRASFINEIIIGSVLPGEITLGAKELHIAYNAFRVVFLINTEKSKDMSTLDVIYSLFPNKTKDFVIVLDDENMVLVKELRANEDIEEVEKAAKIIIDTLNTESMVKAQVGIGSITNCLKDIGRSFKEAQIALRVGEIFENDKFVFNYSNLGIGRLIYQMPISLCELFLKEVFKEDSLKDIDAETTHTIQKFFENNLNISEASRQLYVHRNTLVYRLDKIQKITGLDLRMFDDAIIFKLAMLIRRYLDKERKTL